MSKYRVDDNLSESFDAAQSQAAQFGKPPPAWDAVRRARRLRRATGAALAVISALVVAAAALWTEGDRATAPTSNTHLAVDPGRAPSSQTRGHVITELLPPVAPTASASMPRANAIVLPLPPRATVTSIERASPEWSAWWATQGQANTSEHADTASRLAAPAPATAGNEATDDGMPK